MSVVIYYNPNCSKSRKALSLLKTKSRPIIVEYLRVPLKISEINIILSMMGKKPRDIIRAKEAKEEKIDIENASDPYLISAIVNNPRILERPIVVAGGKAVLGRPPEKVLEIL